MISRAITMIELVNPMTYSAYRGLEENLVKEGKATGAEQSEERLNFKKSNLQRMKRVEKQFELLPALESLLQQQRPNWHWLVLVDTWCGRDGAQLVPAISQIAAAVPGIALTILFRDENPLLMETCLTNGSRSTPLLICKDLTTQKRLFTWCPCSTGLQEQLAANKAAQQVATQDKMALQLPERYTKDQSLSLQEDLLMLAEQVCNKAS